MILKSFVVLSVLVTSALCTLHNTDDLSEMKSILEDIIIRLDEKEARISQLEAKVRVQEVTMHEQESTMHEQDVSIREQQGKVTALEAEVAIQKKTVKALQDQLDQEAKNEDDHTDHHTNPNSSIKTGTCNINYWI